MIIRLPLLSQMELTRSLIRSNTPSSRPQLYNYVFILLAFVFLAKKRDKRWEGERVYEKKERGGDYKEKEKLTEKRGGGGGGREGRRTYQAEINVRRLKYVWTLPLPFPCNCVAAYRMGYPSIQKERLHWETVSGTIHLAKSSPPPPPPPTPLLPVPFLCSPYC